jgi:hypothetical protein
MSLFPSFFHGMARGRGRGGMVLACAAALVLTLVSTLVLVSVTKAGIQGSGIRRVATFGTITPGSELIVNDVAYNTSGASVVVNGEPGSVGSLHSGHIISIKGTVPENGGKPTAEEITLVSEVRGEVTGVDASAGTLTVLGQVIRVPAGVSGLEPGMLVTVSGFADSEGIFNASSIDIEAVQALAQVKGVVQALDGERAVLRVGNLTVDYSSAAVQGTVAEGVTVIAKGIAAGTGNTLTASSIEVYAGVGEPGAKGDLEGVITAFASAQDFDVNGQQVLADSDTKYQLHGTELGIDVQVKVKGRFDAAGVLVADKIQAEKPPKNK